MLIARVIRNMPMMKPMATICMATSLGIPNRLQASGISSRASTSGQITGPPALNA